MNSRLLVTLLVPALVCGLVAGPAARAGTPGTPSTALESRTYWLAQSEAPEAASDATPSIEDQILALRRERERYEGGLPEAAIAIGGVLMGLGVLSLVPLAICGIVSAAATSSGSGDDTDGCDSTSSRSGEGSRSAWEWARSSAASWRTATTRTG